MYPFEDALDIAAQAPTLQTRKQQFVRGAIWDAAIDLFAQKGFDETTVEDIAQVAGVSRRSFFRYFSSKNDLMGQGIVMYGKALTDAIKACPHTGSLLEVVRETVLHIAQGAAAQPRTRKIMEIAASNPAARDAQLARLTEVEERVAQAFAARCRKDSKDDLTPRLLAGLTLFILDVTFRLWFEHDQEDISVTTERVFVKLGHLICEDVKSSEKNQSAGKRPASAMGTQRKRSKA